MKHDIIIPLNLIHDTMVNEKVLSMGDIMHRCSLAACIKRYFGIELSKEVRGLLQKLGVYNKRVYEYSAMDVVYLPRLLELQRKEAEKKDLITTIDTIGRPFVTVLTYIEWCGIKVDTDLWRKKMSLDAVEVLKKQMKLDEFVFESDFNKYKQSQLNFFSDKPETTINWSSTKQVIPFFKDLGIKTSMWDKKKERYKDSLDSNNLNDNDHKIVPIYKEYMKARKVVTSYGQNYLNIIEKFDDKRLRTNFKQILSTGRTASGDGNVNFQNIPRVPDDSDRSREIYERECFVPEEGNVFIVADYASQESRVLAEISQAPNLVKFYISGEADLHSYAVKLVYSKEYPEMENMSLKEIKKNFPKLRQIMKALNFALTLAPCCSNAA